jgi:NADPH-dependent glutamate synthase beta subunit-like oxidoreductase/coenzyme F420-reducing hydrogenase delta subunit/NAD-dependent dihydropyrimidine dehydrogenase PreA subunit
MSDEIPRDEERSMSGKSAESEIEKMGSHLQRVAALKETRPYSPCRAACPVNTDVQAYVGFIAQGRYNEAFEVIRSVNPIASVCSMICHHPCEQACRRCAVDEPLAVRPLKRFTLERAADYRRSKRRLVKKTKGKSIGIIGSGPSGLTAANDLADLGYQVTIYERQPVLGGMLASAIPPYRLPRETLQEDIDDVVSKGIEVKTNCEIGRNITMNDIIAKHDSVLIAVGLSLSRSLNIPGVEGSGVLLAIPFLEDVAFNRKPALGNKVLVIGGGNVAIDVARSARRLGAENVEMVCLESAEEMPAWKWEVDEAVEEGITISHRWGPKEVRREGDKVEGLDVVKVTQVFDSNGRFNPTFDKDRTMFIEADSIIITIGQMANISFLKDSPIQVDERGRVIWDTKTHMSSAKGVFVSGEVVTGPGSAIAAAASGHRSAMAIHLYLQGEKIEGNLPSYEKEKISQMPADVIERINREPRMKIKHLPPETRCSSFASFEFSYDEEAALREAGRCRGCGGGAVVDKKKCMACLTCQRVCPYGAPVVSSVSEIRPEFCQACGLCAPECPGQAISMVSYDVREFRDMMSSIVGVVDPKRHEPVIVAFVCSHHVGVLGFDLPENVRKVPVHCTSRVDVNDLLKALECGADGVAVVRCSGVSCKYKGIENRVSARVGRMKHLVGMLGMESGRIEILTADSHDGNSYAEVCADFAVLIKHIGLRVTKP